MKNREKDLLMLRAVEHAKKSEYDKAISVIDQILKEEPNEPLAIFNKAFTLRTAGRITEAENFFHYLLDIEPDSAGAHHQLGIIMMEKGDLNRALTHFTQATQIRPMLNESWFERGAVLMKLSRFKEAEEILRQGSVFDPDNTAIWDQIGVCCQNEGNFAEAIRCFNHAIELNHTNIQVYFHKAHLFEQMGKRKEEITCYEEIIKFDPENLFAWLKKGLALMLSGEYEYSIRCLSLATRLEDPGYMPFLLKGLVLAVLDRFEEAILCFEQAYALSPLESDVSVHLGKAYGSCNRAEDALGAFERVLCMNPDHSEAREGKARALFHLKRWDELCTLCSQCRISDRKNSLWYLLEARCRAWFLGEQEMGLLIIEEGLQLIDDDENLLSLKSDILADMNMNAEAIETLTTGILKNPDSVALLYRSATLHANPGKYHIAASYLDHIHRLRPEDGQVLYLAGEAYERMGDIDTALERYTSAIAEDPTNPLIWLVRGRLLLDLGHFEDAVVSARQAALLSDNWFDAWFLLGKAEKEAGYFKDARKTLTYVTQIKPEDPDGWSLLGDVLYKIHEPKAARIAYDRALVIDKYHMDARVGKIGALLFVGDEDGAMAEYDISLSLRGDNFWDLLGKANIFIDSERYEEAFSYLEKAQKHVGSDPGALSHLANRWCDLCEFARADAIYEKSLEIDPDNAEVWRWRGQELKDANKYTQAIACFERALEIDPKDDDSYWAIKNCQDVLDGKVKPLILSLKRQHLLKSETLPKEGSKQDG